MEIVKLNISTFLENLWVSFFSWFLFCHFYSDTTRLHFSSQVRTSPVTW